MDTTITRIQQIEQLLIKLKEPAFRKKQILHALFQEHTLDYAEIKTIPLSLRNTLKSSLGDILTITPKNKLKEISLQKFFLKQEMAQKSKVSE